MDVRIVEDQRRHFRFDAGQMHLGRSKKAPQTSEIRFSVLERPEQTTIRISTSEAQVPTSLVI